MCLLDRILQPGGLSVVFQPILRRTPESWHLHGFEALVRGPAGTNMESPDVLFEYVRRKRAESLVDRHCISEIFRAALPLGPRTRLSFNVHAATLEQDSRFVDCLLSAMTEFWHDPRRMTVEVIEHSPARSSPQFSATLDALRSTGFKIALDDVGLGDSNYRMILECRPDYFKVDRYLVAGSSRDYYRRSVLKSIVDLAASFGAQAVAEGIDNVADLQAVLGKGFTMVQGFLLGRPRSVSQLGNPVILARAARELPMIADTPPWQDTSDWLSAAAARFTSKRQSISSG